MSAFFSRILAFLLSLIALFTGGNTANVTIAVQGDVTTQSENIVYEVSNQSAVSVWMDEYFTLEVNQDDEWIPMEQTGMTNDIAWKVGVLLSSVHSINIIDMFGHTLEAGEYRLTKTYSTNSGTDSCSVVFTVTEA